MAKKFGTPIDMNGNQIIKLKAENLASDPTAGSSGRLFWNTSDGDVKVDTGAAIRALVTKTFMQSFGLGTATVPLQNDMGATGIATGFYRTLTTPTDAPVASGEAFDFIHVAGFEDAFMQIAASRTTGVIYTRTAIADGTKGAWTALFNGNWSSITGTPTTLDGYGITDAFPAADAGALAEKDTVGTADIDDEAVTLAKLQHIASARLLGRVTGGTGDPEVLTVAQVKTLLALVVADISDFNTAVDARVVALWDQIAGTDADVDTVRETLDKILANTAALDAVIGRHNADFGDGSSTSYAITHGLNSDDVSVTVYDKSTKKDVEVDVTRTSVNQVTIGVNPAPGTNAYRVVIKK